MVKPNVVFIFIDGIGIGKHDESNPLIDLSFRWLSYMDGSHQNVISDDFVFKSIDASLGLPGLPQSSTGQTALFTGVNPIPTVNGHISGFPTVALRGIISEFSIFKQIEDLGIETLFANAYHKEYFLRKPSMYSATTHAVFAKRDMNFRNLDHLRRREAVFADVTNEYLINEGYDIEKILPEEAASVLMKLSKKYRFLLFEIPFLDGLAHKMMKDRLITSLYNIDRLIAATVNKIKNNTVMIISSDHGNLEDLSSKSHTTNPVPLMIWGRGADKISESITGIEDITPAIVRLLKY